MNICPTKVKHGHCEIVLIFNNIFSMYGKLYNVHTGCLTEHDSCEIVYIFDNIIIDNN